VVRIGFFVFLGQTLDTKSILMLKVMMSQSLHNPHAKIVELLLWSAFLPDFIRFFLTDPNNSAPIETGCQRQAFNCLCKWNDWGIQPLFCVKEVTKVQDHSLHVVIYFIFERILYVVLVVCKFRLNMIFYMYYVPYLVLE